MSLIRFPEIRAEHWPDGIRLDFPLRPIGNLRWIGLLPILFGLGFASVPAAWTWSMARQALTGKTHGVELFFLLFVLLFVVAGLIPVGAGLLVLCGRSRLIANRDTIKVTELAPLVRRSRKIRVSEIERLEWVDAARGTHSGLPPFIARLGGLSAKMKQGTSKLLLIGYPGEWMEEVGKELSIFLQFASAGVLLEKVEAPVPPSGLELADLQQQPAGSTIKLTESARGITLEIPPLGFKAKTKGLIVFSIFWLLMVSVLGFFLANPFRERYFLGPLLFLSAFLAVGLAMLYLGLRMAMRRARITADGSELSITQWGPFRSKSFKWNRAEISSLKAGESGMKINDQPVLELQVFSSTGKKGFLGGRDQEELRWVATKLRKALHLTAEPETDNS